MKVTFDPAKRAVTLTQRGLYFADAALVFAGLHIIRRDERPLYNEDRFITVGVIGETVVVIV